jgi:hypothetical protein
MNYTVTTTIDGDTYVLTIIEIASKGEEVFIDVHYPEIRLKDTKIFELGKRAGREEVQEQLRGLLGVVNCKCED